MNGSIECSPFDKLRANGDCHINWCVCINIAGLQLADVLAHPVKQSCLLEKGLIPSLSDTFGQKLIKVVDKKFNCHEWRGVVEGYGKIWL